MTKQGKYNLLAIAGLPTAAVVGAWIGTQTGVWQAYSNTYIWLFVMNLIMIGLFGLLCALLLRWSDGERARWLAITPVLVMAGSGAGTYIWYAFFPNRIAAGAEFLGAPQYLAVIGLGLIFLVLLLRVTGIVKRTA